MKETTLTAPGYNPWIVSPRWDLFWLTLSALLVAIPPLAYYYWKVGSTGVDLLVTAMIGGPHMYATFLRTVMEPKFRERHPILAWAPVICVPLAVVTLAIFAFDTLLSLFFIWASIHICDQASFIASRYRARFGEVTMVDRGLDFLAAMSALYVVAIYRFVEGTFVISGHVIWFPPFLKVPIVPRLFAFGAACVIATWAVRSWNQYRAKKIGAPYILFMATTIVVGFFVPTMGELSVSFQGFNAWHSFQYLGLTFLALRRRESTGGITMGFVKDLSRPGHFFKFYGWNVLLTMGAGILVGILVFVLKLEPERCYYTVTLSFLLVHYFHDHILFSDSTEAVLATA